MSPQNQIKRTDLKKHLICQVVTELLVIIWLTCLSKVRIMTDIKSRLEVGVFNMLQGSALDIRKAPGEMPYARGTINCIEYLLASVMVW